MLKNYFIIAVRGLRRNRGYAFINVAGLAVGLACFLLIMLFIRHEFSYDRFHENADRIHRVYQQQPGNVFLGSNYFAVTPAPLAATLTSEYPEVAAATTIRTRSGLLGAGDSRYWEEGLWADARFFDVFSFPLIRGREESALVEPGSIILTESLSRKLFGEDDPIGRTIRIGNDEELTITAVMADVPVNSSLQFAFVGNIQSQSDYVSSLERQSWRNSSWHTFFRLEEGADASSLQARMPALIEKYVANNEDEAAEKDRYLIEPLTEVHLQTTVNFDLGAKGNISTVYLFSAIAIVILLLACINYMNLAVARSIKRTREVGMRKVIGAGKRQLIAQFLGESMLMTVFAMILALILAHFLMPFFGELVKRTLEMVYRPADVALLSALVIIVGVVAGSYPAFFMASLKPMQVLKGNTVSGTARFRVQRLLIVGQYAVSIALVAGSFVIYEQLRFIQEKELGYDREHIVTVTVRDRALVQNYPQIRNELMRQASFLAVTSSDHLPTNIASSTSISGWEGSDEDDELQIYHNSVDYDFLDVFGIELVAGRTFSREIAGDSLDGFIVNETAARGMGWSPEEAVGKTFNGGDGSSYTIIGIVKDFHMHSLHLPIQPLMMSVNGDWIGHISARIRPGGLPNTIASLERVVTQFTSFPFEYEFLDDSFNKLYDSETRLGRTFGFFTVLALVIASLGLFGLAAFAAEQRTKEIGIRKVLGADVSGLVALLSREFLTLVGIAFVLATPLAWYAMQRWLEDFAYRVEIGPGVFLLTGISAIVIALATVSYQCIRAALADPVKSLRYE